MNPRILSSSGPASLNGLASNATWAASEHQEKANHGTHMNWEKTELDKIISGALNDHIDNAYRAKYGTSSYLGPMISEHSRAATVLVLPKDGAQ